MLTTAKATRKVLSQYITVYQGILEFPIEKLWMEIIIKHNKEDVDAMLDDVNAKLIEVCDEYLQSHKLSLDKFALSTLVMDLYTQTVSSLDAPFRVTIKENKALIQEYLEKNKQKLATMERIKAENAKLDGDIKQAEIDAKEKKEKIRTIETVYANEEDNLQVKPIAKAQKKAKQKYTWNTNSLATSFSLPY